MELRSISFIVLIFALNFIVSVNAAPCPPPITVPGTYVMTEDYTGAPYENVIVSGTSCVKITASDVIFDCNNHYIQNDGTPDSSGIFVGNNPYVRNVTIKNCGDIQDYTYGIFFYKTENSRVEKVVLNENNVGVYIYLGKNNTLFNNTMYSNENGVVITSSSKNNLTQNIVSSQRESGIALSTAERNTIKENKIYSNGNYGISLTLLSYYNNFTGNVIKNHRVEGVYAHMSSHNYFYNNSAEDNGMRGFDFQYSHNITLIKNKAKNNIVGFLIEKSEDCILKNNTAIQSAETSIVIGLLSHRAKVENNTAKDSKHGIYIDNSNGVIVDNFKTYNNKRYGVYATSAYGLQLKNVYISNSSTEVYLQSGGPLASVSATNITIDNPNGGFVNKTVLNIFDSIANGEWLSIRWIRNTYPLPPGKSSFHGKFVNISGNAAINKIEWVWTSSEVSGYDEESLEVARYTGSGWIRVSAILDIVQHKLSVYGLMPASIYGILGNGSASNYTLTNIYRANITNRTNLARWEGTGEAGRATIEGGNVSDLNLSSATLTDRWAAFYGNIIGSIYLTTASGGLLNYVYAWNWAPAYGGSVCVSTNSSMLTINVTGASGRDIDSAWNFGEVADNGRNTFVGLGCNLLLGSANVTGADFADTGTPGGFRTCALKTKKSPAKDNLLFCTRIDANGVAFDGKSVNFELIAPTTPGTGVLETYYFYAAFD